MANADDRLCNLLEPCSTPEAPLCPLQEISLKTALWYGDEPICEGENFQNIYWIKKQKQISELGLKADDGFFTVRMLSALRAVGKNLKGADPDDVRAEIKWLKQHQERMTEARDKSQSKLNKSKSNQDQNKQTRKGKLLTDKRLESARSKMLPEMKGIQRDFFRNLQRPKKLL